MRMEGDHLYGWIKKVTYAKISPRMVNPGDIAGSAKKKKKKKRRREGDLGIASRFLYRLVGLVVKASASRAEGPGFESRLCQDFFGVESYQ